MHYRSLLTATALLASSSNAFPLQPRDGSLSFDYDSQKVQGVNLGGWFVLEPWITPSIFSEWADNQQVVDEYTYTKVLGKTEAQKRLSAHWDSWITENDFKQIADMGLNHVRIPIGYWAVNPQDGDPYVNGQLTVLDNAIKWAETHNLKVMIDLHGAPGSQNGFDNSGRKGDITWSQADSNGDIAKQAIINLAQRYAGSTAVTLIQPVNEPLSTTGQLDVNFVKQYYYDVWGAIRKVNSQQNTPSTGVAIHDAFQGPNYWNGFMTSGFDNVLVDTHIYQIFDSQISMSPSEHVQQACSWGPKLKDTDHWTVVGEWTGAQTDCALWLNGLGIGARYDGTYPGSSHVGSCDGKRSGTVENLSSDDKKNIRSLIEAQLDSYSARSGWIFWTWKNEAAPEWHLQNLTAAGLFPQPLDNRQYPNQCGS